MKNCQTIASRAALLGAVLVSLVCFDARADHGAEKVTTGKIGRIQAEGHGAFWFTLEGNPQLCVDDGNRDAGLVQVGQHTRKGNLTKEGVDFLIRTALAAKIAGQEVIVGAHASNGEWGCRVWAISIK